MTSGVVEKYENRMDDEVYLGLTAVLPDDAGWVLLHRALGFDNEFYAVFSQLPAATRDRLLDYYTPWDEMVTPGLIVNLFQLRSLMPNFDWERLIRATHSPMRVPEQFTNRVRAESALLWARRQQGRQEIRNQRERARIWERAGSYRRIAELRQLGLTLVQVGERVGRSPSVVSKIIREFEPLTPAKKAAIADALSKVQDAQAELDRRTTPARERKARIAYEAAVQAARRCGAYQTRYVLPRLPNPDTLTQVSHHDPKSASI
jgi:transcriptional regulator with XRE-family HTH domain